MNEKKGCVVGMGKPYIGVHPMEERAWSPNWENH